jgi:1-acyl-sn-glycerol-3-phosphate acyltransferase
VVKASTSPLGKLHSMRFFYKFYGVISVLFLLAACLLIVLLTGIPLMLIPRKHRWKFGIWTNVALSHFYVQGFPLFCRMQKEGRENIPRDRGFLVVVNHRSAVDIPLVIADTHAQGLSKKNVFYIPGVGLLGFFGGALYFDRRDKNARKNVSRRAIECMKRGQALHVYPQGTRVADGREVRIHLGMIKACFEAGVSVLPTALMHTDKVAGGNVSVRPFQKVRVSYLAIMEPADFADAEVFAETCWQRVVAESERLQAIDAL